MAYDVIAGKPKYIRADMGVSHWTQPMQQKRARQQ